MVKPATQPPHPTRITEQLEQYWQHLRSGGSLPREDQIDPIVLGEAWNHCFLVSARANGSFAYNYLGKELADAYGDDIVGKEITETLLFMHPQSLHSSFKRAVMEREPITDDSEFTNSQGKHIRYRACILPLAGNGREGVAFLLGGMKWKAY